MNHPGFVKLHGARLNVTRVQTIVGPHACALHSIIRTQSGRSGHVIVNRSTCCYRGQTYIILQWKKWAFWNLLPLIMMMITIFSSTQTLKWPYMSPSCNAVSTCMVYRVTSRCNAELTSVTILKGVGQNSLVKMTSR